MLWNKHYGFEGTHAVLGASNYHWLNYDKEKLRNYWLANQTKIRGTKLHDFARQAIELGIKLPSRPKTTLGMYVNDAIGYRMQPEQIVWYSKNIYGTADTISYHDDLLRIHDLKTGAIPAHIEQLEIYAALFCLEYNIKPGAIKFELRIYQNNNILIEKPEVDKILPIMNKIIEFDKYLTKLDTDGGM